MALEGCPSVLLVAVGAGGSCEMVGSLQLPAVPLPSLVLFDHDARYVCLLF